MSSPRTLVPLLAIPLLALVPACGSDSDGSGVSPGSGGGYAGTATGDGPRLLGTVPKFKLVDQDGQQTNRGKYIGKVWVATFVFTRCAATCPAQTREMAALQKELASHPQADDIRLVSISVDPNNDTPQVLKEYAEAAGADPARWSHLTGEPSEIKELCEDGFKLSVLDASENPEGVIAHSQYFVLVDRVARIRGYYDGLDADARDQLARDLDEVLDDPRWPIWKDRKQADDDRPGQVVYEPREIEKVDWMEERAAAQRATLPRFEVFHDFKFTDRQPGSGLDFDHRCVNDAAIDYKAVHYDHGNGVAVADVDGDGRLDLYFVNQVGDNKLYRNKGGGKFEDVTEAAGVALGDRIGVSASFADVDNDGDPDLYVTSVRAGNVLFENKGGGEFEDVTEAAGLTHQAHSSGAVFFDYDRDGLLDLFLCNVGVYTEDEVGPDGAYVGVRDGFYGHQLGRDERSVLYRNTGGNRFEDVSEKVGLVDESWTGDAAPIDLNRDGWIDLYVLAMQGHDQYYENQGGERFVKKSREVFPRTSWGAMGIQVFDFDNDGFDDIYVTDMHTDMVDDFMRVRRYWYAEKLKMVRTFPPDFLATDLNHVLGNAFFRNQGDGSFEEISDHIGAETYWPWGLSTGDLNADGWEDVFVTGSMNFPWRYGVNSVLLNNKGRSFLDSEFVLGVEPRRDGRTAVPWFEFDTADELPGEITPQLAKGREGEVTVYGAIGTRSSAIFDLEGDGDLDVVTADFNSEPMVLVSNLSEKTDVRYLEVRLVGSESNKDGLGAAVTVKTGEGSYRKVLDGVSGYLSHSVMPLYFGLGDAAQVDSIQVVWPSGKEQTVAGPIEANQRLTVTEE